MNIATVKQQARDLERQGKTAAALDAYEEIIARLECDAIEPEAPLFVKVGDLSLKTGDKLGAIARFERAAEQYARQGSNRSVIALCLKILRTAPHRTDVHIRFAKQLLKNGFVEPTRLVLVDYAERAKLPKTLNTLQRLAVRPESEIRAMLERFFETAERGQQMAGHTGEMPAVILPADAVGQPPRLPSVDESVRPAARQRPPHAAPVRTAEHQASVPGRDPIMAELRRPAPQVTRPPATESAAPEAGRRATARTRQPEPAAPRSGFFARIRRSWRPRPVWVYPAAAAMAVVVLGVGFFAFGAVPFGGELDAEQPAMTVPQATPSRSTLMMVAAFGATDSEQQAQLEAPSAAPVETPVATAAPADSTASAGLSERAPLVPVALDSSALAAATRAARSAQPEAIDIPIDNALEDVGRIAIPTTLPAASELVSRAAAAAPRATANEPVIAIADLEIAAVARGPDSYQVVQRLATGEQISLSVIPFSDAPDGESGRLQVEVSGDSAVGTVRFHDSFVTARAPIAPTTLERLLEALMVRGGSTRK